jgi:hypothetical protein
LNISLNKNGDVESNSNNYTNRNSEAKVFSFKLNGKNASLALIINDIDIKNNANKIRVKFSNGIKEKNVGVSKGYIITDYSSNNNNKIDKVTILDKNERILYEE